MWRAEQARVLARSSSTCRSMRAVGLERRQVGRWRIEGAHQGVQRLGTGAQAEHRPSCGRRRGGAGPGSGRHRRPTTCRCRSGRPAVTSGWPRTLADEARRPRPRGRRRGRHPPRGRQAGHDRGRCASRRCRPRRGPCRGCRRARNWSWAGSSGSARRSTQVLRRRKPPGGSVSRARRTGMTGKVRPCRSSSACRSRASWTSRCCQVPSPVGPRKTATAAERAMPCSRAGSQGWPAASWSRSRKVWRPASLSCACTRSTAVRVGTAVAQEDIGNVRPTRPGCGRCLQIGHGRLLIVSCRGRA